jgi:glycosyltransferase involved in cell wall biosynthesis
MVDEIWAPSRFIQLAFQEKTKKPVLHMPLCVSLPPFERRSKGFFGLPDNHYLFLFAFDFSSYVDRKNPMGAIRAFHVAFPNRAESVGLVIKVMNVDKRSEKWKQIIKLVNRDPRIFILDVQMSRADVLALFDACDAFISLHRSEGFGRGPAEAMLMGKPVIATNYSGNTDFMNEGNSYPVRYDLVPVGEGEYPFAHGQVWAEPDISDAAVNMRAIADDPDAAARKGFVARQFIQDNFSPCVIGEKYLKRITEISRRAAI